MKKNLLLLFLFFVIGGYAQNPPLYNFGSQDGLISLEVYDLFVSKDSYIFLGTDAGLIKYNGSHFIPCRPENNEEFGVSNIQEHANSGIYSLTFDGRLFLYENNQQILLSKSIINDYFITQNGILFFKKKKLYKADLHLNNEVLVYDYSELGAFFGILNDQVFIIKNSLYSNDGKFIDSIPHISNRFHWNNEQILADKTNKILYRLNENNKLIPLFKDDKLKDLGVLTSTSYLDGKGFVNSFSGSYDLYNNRILLKDFVITDAVKDREGNYWFSSLGNGVFMIPFLEAKEYKLKYSPIEKRPDKIVVDDEGNAFVFGIEYVYFINNKTGEVQYRHRLPDIKECQSVFFDKKQHQIIFENSGLWTWDSRHPEKPPQKIGVGNIKWFEPFEDIGMMARDWNYFNILIKEHNINKIKSHWVGKYLKPGGRVLSHFTELVFTNLERDNNNARFIVYNQLNSSLLLAFSDGLTLLNEQEIMELTINNQPIIATTLANDDNGDFLIAVKQSGIYTLNAQGKIELLINSPEVVENRVFKIETQEDYIWLLTNEHIYQYNRQTKELKEISLKFGVGNYTYRDIAIDEQNLYIATNESVIILPLNVETNIVAPILSKVSVFSQGTSLQPEKEYTFPFKNNELSIHLEAISYRESGKFNYKYQLIGYDKEFKNLPAQTPVITYRLLPPGNYQLKAYAENFDGNKSEEFIFNFSITPLFWQQWWFYILISLSVALTAFVIGYNYIKRVRKENDLKTQAIESKLTSIKAQMNPHFIFNALGSIQYLVLRGEIKNANNYLGKFSKLMRSVLEMSEQNAISLEEEVNILDVYLSLEKLRMGEEFNYEIIVDKELKTQVVQLPPLLIQPYVENAVRHGLLHKMGDKNLKIEFQSTPQDDSFRCIISDNGVGMKASTKLNKRSGKHRSFSSKANQNRIQLFNKRYPGYFDIVYTDLDDGGTEVSISIPSNFIG